MSDGIDVVVIFERHGALIANPPAPELAEDGTPIAEELPDPYGDTLWDWNLTDGAGASLDSAPLSFPTLYDAQAHFILAYGNIAGGVTVQVNDNACTITGTIASLTRNDA